MTAETVARSIEQLSVTPADVVVAGGGMRNPFLLRSLEERLAPLPVRVSDALGCPAGAREAAAFALLAAAFVWGIPASFPGTTGVMHRAILGKLSLPPATGGIR